MSYLLAVVGCTILYLLISVQCTLQVLMHAYFFKINFQHLYCLEHIHLQNFSDIFLTLFY